MVDSIKFKNTKVGMSGKSKRERIKAIKNKRAFDWDYRWSPEGRIDFLKLLNDHGMTREQIGIAIDNGYDLKMQLKRKGEKPENRYIQSVNRKKDDLFNILG